MVWIGWMGTGIRFQMQKTYVRTRMLSGGTQTTMVVLMIQTGMTWSTVLTNAHLSMHRCTIMIAMAALTTPTRMVCGTMSTCVSLRSRTRFGPLERTVAGQSIRPLLSPSRNRQGMEHCGVETSQCAGPFWMRMEMHFRLGLKSQSSVSR